MRHLSTHVVKVYPSCYAFAILVKEPFLLHRMFWKGPFTSLIFSKRAFVGPFWSRRSFMLQQGPRTRNVTRLPWRFRRPAFNRSAGHPWRALAPSKLVTLLLGANVLSHSGHLINRNQVAGRQWPDVARTWFCVNFSRLHFAETPAPGRRGRNQTGQCVEFLIHHNSPACGGTKSLSR